MRVISFLLSLFVVLLISTPCFALSSTHIDALASVSAPYPNTDTDHLTIENASTGSAAVSVAAFVEQADTRYKVQDDESTVNASFDLTRGEVKFDLYATGDGAYSFLNITLYDEIFPQWEVGTPGDRPIEVTLSWSMEGIYEISSGSLKNFTLQTGGVADLDTTHPYDFDFTPYPSWTNLADGSETWTTTILFDPSVNSHIGFQLYVNATLDTHTTQWASADFSHTGLFDIQLPEGAIFTSSSGLLLTNIDDEGQGNNPVPEPSTFFLFSSGLVGLGFYAGKRKKA